jgi:adenylosuccinate synthase
VIEKVRLIRRMLVGEAAMLGISTGPLAEEEIFVQFMEDTEKLASPPLNVIRDDFVELARAGNLIFEGSQGVLLDQTYGFHPHTTWSTTTRKNALDLLTGLNAEVSTIGVIRTYQTRHGNGPFVSEYLPEDASFSSRVAAKLRVEHREDHNDDSGLAGTFRTGWLDLVATRYAIDCCRVNSIAVTHMDRIVADTVTVCDGYTYTGTMTDIAPYFSVPSGSKSFSRIRCPLNTRTHAHMECVTNRLRDCKPMLLSVPQHRFIEILERRLETPVSILSDSPTASGKQWINEPRRPEPVPAAAASI